ncbi:MAG: hypothetical protein LBM75_03090 [Myxococcales bacterium]|jgi:hypothetical protein|nr:hypothetical protein [Myxococcales bacterium]
MPKSKKRIKKPQREGNSVRSTRNDLDDGESVGLISSLRGGFQDLAGARPQKKSAASKKGMGIGGLLLILLVLAALVALWARARC